MNKIALAVFLALFLLNVPFSNVEAGLLDDLKKLGDKAVETVNEVGKAVDGALTEEDPKTQPDQAPATQAPAQKASPAKTQSKPTASKADVKRAQTLLAKLGYDAGTADGLMGKKSRNAIIAFQKQKGIAQDGVVSAALLSNLEASAVAVPSTPAKQQSTAKSETTTPKKTSASNANLTVMQKQANTLKAFPVEDGYKVMSGDYGRFEYQEHTGGRFSVSLYFEQRKDFAVGYIERYHRGRIHRSASVNFPNLKPEDCRPESSDPAVTMQFAGYQLKLYPKSYHKFACKLESREDLSRKLIEAVSGAEKVDITIKLPGFEGDTQGKYRVINSANIAKEPVKQAVAPAPKVVVNPVPKKQVSQTIMKEPVYQDCTKDTYLAQFYDCACFAEGAGAERIKLEAKKKEQNKGMIVYRQNNVDRMKAQLADEKAKPSPDSKKIALLEKNIAHGEDTVAQLKDPSGTITSKQIMTSLADSPSCKIPDKIRADGRGKCLKKKNRLDVKGQTVEEFCQCVGDKMADIWMSDARGYSSQWVVPAGVQAHTSCK